MSWEMEDAYEAVAEYFGRTITPAEMATLTHIGVDPPTYYALLWHFALEAIGVTDVDQQVRAFEFIRALGARERAREDVEEGSGESSLPPLEDILMTPEWFERGG
jgi:hypothetical protein